MLNIYTKRHLAVRNMYYILSHQIWCCTTDHSDNETQNVDLYIHREASCGLKFLLHIKWQRKWQFENILHGQKIQFLVYLFINCMMVKIYYNYLVSGVLKKSKSKLEYLLYVLDGFQIKERPQAFQSSFLGEKQCIGCI